MSRGEGDPNTGKISQGFIEQDLFFAQQPGKDCLFIYASQKIFPSSVSSSGDYRDGGYFDEKYPDHE